jgi:hypothetical protein
MPVLIKTEYLIYRPGVAEPEALSVDWPEEPGYAAVKAIVEPIVGPLEHVSVLFEGRRSDMFVNEFGTGCFGHERLPVNEAATKIYHAASIARGTDTTWAPMIYGVAVLFSKRQVWF